MLSFIYVWDFIKTYNNYYKKYPVAFHILPREEPEVQATLSENCKIYPYSSFAFAIASNAALRYKKRRYYKFGPQTCLRYRCIMCTPCWNTNEYETKT